MSDTAFKQGDRIRYNKLEGTFMGGNGVTCTIQIEGRFIPYVPVDKLTRMKSQQEEPAPAPRAALPVIHRDPNEEPSKPYVYRSLKDREKDRKADLQSRLVEGGMSTWTKASFDGGPKSWCVKIAADLVGKVKAGDVVRVENSHGDPQYVILSLQIEERPDCWEPEERPTTLGS